MRRWIAGFGLVVGLFAGGSAYAQEGGDKAAAEALFDEGRRLMAAGDYAAACPKLEASQRLDPGVGTILNLADCHQKAGKVASAWAEFREAVSAAHTAGSLEREEIARSRANELEAKLSYLTIEAWKGQRVQVTRDGIAVDAAVVGTPIPVDPGTHTISASAPGKRTWSTTIQVGAIADKVSVAIPILPDESVSGGAPSASVAEAGSSTAPASAPGSTQRILGIVVGAVGVVGIGVGIGFGLQASSQWSDAKSHCNPSPYCGQQGVALEHDAKTSATISTIAFAVGLAGIAGGLTLYFTAPNTRSDSEVALSVGPGNVLVQGRF